MAAIKPTYRNVGRGDGSCQLVVWTPVTENDTCVAAELPDLADKSVHVYGTFGGATVAVQGSNNDGTSFAALNDPSSTVIAINSEKIKQVLENTQQIRPAATGGASQSLSIAMLIKQTNPLRQ
jgi:hypothetical protein